MRPVHRMPLRLFRSSHSPVLRGRAPESAGPAPATGMPVRHSPPRARKRSPGAQTVRSSRRLRVVSAASATILATGILAGCGAAASGGGGGSKTVTIALPVAEPVQSPVYLASKLGYFKQAGINAHVVVLASDTAADAAMIAGSVQYTSVNAVALLHAAGKGVPVQNFCTEYNGPAWALVVSPSALNRTHVTSGMPIKQLFTALHGLNVAIVGTSASAPGLMLTGLLKQEGLPANWVNLIGVSASSALSTAYQHGEVDAVFDTQPTPDELSQRISGKVVFNTTQLAALRQVPWEGLVGTKDYLKSNAATNKAVCKAIGRADNYLLNNPAGAVSTLSGTFPHLSTTLLGEAVRSYGWAPNGRMTAAQWTAAGNVLSQFGLIKRPQPATLAGAFTTSYLP